MTHIRGDLPGQLIWKAEQSLLHVVQAEKRLEIDTSVEDHTREKEQRHGHKEHLKLVIHVRPQVSAMQVAISDKDPKI